MLALAVHFLEALVISLICFLAYRIHGLSKETNVKTTEEEFNQFIKKALQTAPKKSQKENYEDKMESLKMAQVFAGSQMVEIKRTFGDLREEQLDWLREAISLYLIGATDFIGKQTNCGTKSRKELIQLVLKSNLHVSQENATEYFSEALHRQPQSDNDHMVRAGARAARIWLKQNKVPSDVALRTQLDGWGVFA